MSTQSQAHLQQLERRFLAAAEQGRFCTKCVREAVEAVQAGSIPTTSSCVGCPVRQTWLDLREQLRSEEEVMPAAVPPPPPPAPQRGELRQAVDVELSSPKLRALELRLAQADARSERQHRSSKVALGKLKETIIRGAVSEAALDAGCHDGVSSKTGEPCHDCCDEVDISDSGKVQRRTTVYLDPEKYKQESGMLKRKQILDGDVEEKPR